MADPFDLFFSWYPQVYSAEKENSNAVILSTSSAGGRVSSRVVLLKKYDRDGFVFFSNYRSLKGRQLDENQMASMLFYWPEQSRQVRIEGMVEKTGGSESEAYFDSRKPGHKINALVSMQSETIEDPESFREKLAAARKDYMESNPERPSYWGGYRLVPDRFEFWEEGRDRFHSRQEFTYDGTEWHARLLQP